MISWFWWSWCNLNSRSLCI